MFNNSANSIFIWLIPGKLNSAFMSVNELLVRNTWKLFSHPNMYFLCHLDLFSELCVWCKPFLPFSGCPEKNRMYYSISSYTSFRYLTVSCNKHSTYLSMCNMEILFPISECGALFPKKDYFSYLFIDVSPLFWDVKMICKLSTLQQLIRLYFLTLVTSTSLILCSHMNEIFQIHNIICILNR